MPEIISKYLYIYAESNTSNVVINKYYAAFESNKFAVDVYGH